MAKRKSLHEELGPIALPVLQGLMQSAANESKLPKRFKTDDSNCPRMIITDLITNRSVEVPLYAYSNVIETLTTLFPD